MTVDECEEESMTQDSLDLGADLRDQALETVEEHADPDWLEVAKGCLVRVASRRRLFTADDIRDELEESAPTIRTHEPRAMGAVFLWARTNQIASPTDTFIPTRRPQGHKGPRRVWRSDIR